MLLQNRGLKYRDYDILVNIHTTSTLSVFIRKTVKTVDVQAKIYHQNPLQWSPIFIYSLSGIFGIYLKHHDCI